MLIPQFGLRKMYWGQSEISLPDSKNSLDLTIYPGNPGSQTLIRGAKNIYKADVCHFPSCYTISAQPHNNPHSIIKHTDL